jgi:glycosyltransferase involved in cell wall biosynthesis
MRILYGITKTNFGGAQRYVYELALYAKSKGHMVAVIAGGNGALVEKLKQEDIEVISLPALGRDISFIDDLKSFFFIIKVLYKWKPDVFHINSSKMGLLGSLAGRVVAIPKIIFTAHGWVFNESRPSYQRTFFKLIYWYILLFSHKIICVSEGTKKDIRNWPLVQNKIIVIKNGVDNFSLLPRSDARRSLGIHEDDILVVGTVAELHHVKGLDLLLNAWSEFVKSCRAELIIIGEGEERENLENMLQSLGISDSVVFKGYMDDARAHMSAFDIFVITSRSEALPYVPLEAGVASLPVIATAVGGIPEIITDEVNGILIPPEDPQIIFLSLLMLAENIELREKLGAELKRTVTDKFSITKMVNDTIKEYERNR